jgi:hypothetical protein
MLKLTYRKVATINALIFFVLALIWMFTPNVILSSWGIEYSYALGMLSRRSAAVYAGLSFMLFFTRNEEASRVRSAFVVGFAVACLTLAVLGVIEFVTGHARIEILVAVLIEMAMAISIWYANK